MNPHDPETLNERMERLERLVESLQRQLDTRQAPAAAAAMAAPAPPASLDAGPPLHPAPPRGRSVRPAAPPPQPVAPWMSWDGQMWLNRLGIVLVLLGVALLFRYSIEQGWLTPAVRVAFGAATGAALFAAGLRLDARRPFGAVLAGGGIAAWYITGWAAFYLYGMVGYPAAFAGMVAITALAFGMALWRGSPVLAVLGAAGGLGTPLILGVSYGSPRGFALYTSLVLAWTSAVYLRRGWRSLLWTTAGFAWVLLWVYAERLPPGWVLPLAFGDTLAPGGALRPGDRWIVQAAIVFAWINLGVIPLVKRVADFRRVRHGHEPHWKRDEAANWYALAALSPVGALLTSAAVWHPRLEAWGGWTLAVAALYAAGAAALYRADARLSRAVLFTASLLVSIGCMAALESHALLAALAAQAIVLQLVARHGGGLPARWMGHKVFVVAVFWMAVRLLGSDDASLDRLVSDFAVITAAAGSAILTSSPRTRLWYLYFAHAAVLGWLWRGLSPLAGGEGFATMAWGAYAIGLMMLATRRGWTLLERTAIATLLLVVAKLFLVDLSALDRLYRVALFLGFGLVFLVLSYALQAWWKAAREPERPRPSLR
jgi:hypothetical protein